MIDLMARAGLTLIAISLVWAVASSDENSAEILMGAVAALLLVTAWPLDDASSIPHKGTAPEEGAE